MSAVPMPPMPEPPHDPTSLLLAGWIGPDPHAGWRGRLDKVRILPARKALILASWPGSARRLTEPSGSFGGLRLPTNAALGPGGDLYLVDRGTGRLKRFDPCACVFEVVPCFADGTLANPMGLAICSGDVFIADTGHHRVLRLSLRGFVPRSPLVLPRAERAKLQGSWTPFALAFDGHGRLYVSDPRHGRIDAFSARGEWLQAVTGLDKPTHLGVDCRDRVLVVVDSVPPIAPVVENGTTVPVAAVIDDGTPARVDVASDELAADFPPSPVPVDARGRLHLATWCTQTPAHPGIFDLDGHPVPAETTAALPLFLVHGTYTSDALDSGLYRCQWHRVLLGGSIPAGGSVQVHTTSSEVQLDGDELATLPEEAWQTRTVAAATGDGEWDCLVRSGPGRFLWVRLVFTSDGFVTPILDRIVVEFPRITSRRYLPAVFSADPVSADFTDRFVSIFDTTLRGLERTLDTQARFFDPLSAPTERGRADDVDFLTWIASWIGITLDRHWPEAQRRRYVKEAAKLYGLRGTPEGLRRAVLLYLGLDANDQRCADSEPKSRCIPRPPNCEPEPSPPPPWEAPRLVLEHFKLRRWLFVGAGRLGSDAELWGKRIVNRSQLGANARAGDTQLISTPDPVRDPFHVYAHRFTVFVPACVRASEPARKGLETLLRAEAPAHTAWDIRYVEPRFRVGVQAVIGYDSVIARTPVGVRLGEATLRQGTVLGPAPHERGGPSLVVGRQSRIGETTRLD